MRPGRPLSVVSVPEVDPVIDQPGAGADFDDAGTVFQQQARRGDRVFPRSKERTDARALDHLPQSVKRLNDNGGRGQGTDVHISTTAKPREWM